MNTRRQTVWLVSMLGLMVILSAYYLFTDEASELPGQQQTAGNDIIVEGVGLMDPTSGQHSVSIEDIAAADGETGTDGATTGEAGSSGDGAAAADAKNSTAKETVSNEQVLRQLANRSGSDAITAMQIARDSDFSRQIEALTAAIASEEATEQQITEAINKHSALMDLEAKLIAFEEKLLANYENAAVMYDGAKQHYTVHVSAAQLEKSEAVSIVTEAMNDLAIAIHQITVKLYN